MKRLVALALGLACAPVAPAAACSIALPTPGAPVSAQVAFTGTVVSATPAASPEPSFDPVTYRFAIDRVLKGATVTSLEVSTSGSSASCGTSFAVGSRYLVFADPQPEDGPFGPKGTLTTGLGAPNAKLGLTGLPPEPLYYPAPGFLRSRSDLSPRQLLARPKPLSFWFGAFDPRGRRLFRILRNGETTTIIYRGGLRVRTQPTGDDPSTVPAPFNIRAGRLTIADLGGRIEIWGPGATRADLEAAVARVAAVRPPRPGG